MPAARGGMLAAATRCRTAAAETSRSSSEAFRPAARSFGGEQRQRTSVSQSVSQSVLLLKVELNRSEEIFNLAQPAAVLVLVVQPELSV
jgi:hypothetical protein